MQAHGPIPEGMHILHSCDNKRCVNIEHLHLGTHNDNMREGVERKRFPRGEAAHPSKLNEFQVRVIRRLLEFPGNSQAWIGGIFGVSQVAISKIKLSKSWKPI
jgi:hypothetical protein